MDNRPLLIDFDADFRASCPDFGFFTVEDAERVAAFVELARNRQEQAANRSERLAA